MKGLTIFNYMDSSKASRRGPTDIGLGWHFFCESKTSQLTD